MKKVLISIQLLFCCSALFAQEVKVRNEGIMYVSPSTVVSVVNDFDNSGKGDVTTEGTIYYYGNFNNDSFFNEQVKGDKKIDNSSLVIFSKLVDDGKTQVISGSSSTYFQNLKLDSDLVTDAFLLQNDLNVNGQVEFTNGIVKIDSLNNGVLTLHKDASVKTVSDNSHVEGLVEKIGKTEFTYPVGDKGLYRYARISAAPNEKDAFDGQYVVNDKKFFATRTNKVGVIKNIDSNEYWLINKNTKNENDGVMLTLSWDERTTPKEILSTPGKDLHIIRWDDKGKIWVDEGGVVDLDRKEVTTVSNVDGYGYFTLGLVDTDILLDGDVVIYNLVNTQDSSLNNYFRIENINKFPNNSVEIFNRWGQRVYFTTNYNSANNVFRGVSEGKVTLNKGEKLPSGTYFYIVKYEYTNEGNSELIKKSGYLHLETN